MRLGTIARDGRRLTVASTDGIAVHDVSRLAGFDGLAGLFSLLDSAEIAGLDIGKYPAVNLAGAEWLPPIPRPDRILCVGLNYATHAAEVLSEVTEHPTLFTRFPSTFVGHNQPLIRPRMSNTLDWEGEIAVIIGTGGRHIRADKAMDHVAGYAPMGENSVREWQLHTKQATAGKNFDATGSWGPWIVTRDEVPDPAALEVITELNGEQMQHGRLSDLIFDVGAIIEYVSAFTELVPGDVIATGTPSGIGHRHEPPRYLVAGDKLSIRIPGLVELNNEVSDEDKVLQ
ncbi:MAG: 5-oxopent-3-ene-1,2,5-tricarboxylate decarboxylase [Gordonia sp. (in: high G+C Gram-positive bacteria)]|nr:MAG: 5-oxopent-3-ene-1,2,5-tricarboxylate decarboxylase [Gordonia sp. (in: high G+C Gram-positive bacteria)]